MWLAAGVVALLIHAGTLAWLHGVRFFTPATVRAEPPPIQLVFAKDDASPAQEPRFFTELPPDRADRPPDHPDALSNVDSRARDRVPGGEAGALPRLTGTSDAPEVALVPGRRPSAPAGSESPEQANPSRDTAAPTRARETADAAQGKEVASGAARPGLPDSVSKVILRQGDSDIPQEAMANMSGNTLLDGEITLNTTAWDYAPWLQRFRRDFVQNWYAPSAYYLGLIHGWNVVRAEIGKDGSLLKLDVLDSQGHPSLVQSSVGAFRALAPYQPLPADFPEDHLVLTVKLVYPEVRRR